jgi:hypothetical protein
MDPQVASYVIGYYGRFLYEQEQLAYRHLIGTAKVTRGRSEGAAQAEARNAKPHLRKLLSDDPEILLLARDGLEAFVERTATRILAKQASAILLNYCPRCKRLAKTPKARQCRFCFHDWHENSATPK